MISKYHFYVILMQKFDFSNAASSKATEIIAIAFRWIKMVLYEMALLAYLAHVSDPDWRAIHFSVILHPYLEFKQSFISYLDAKESSSYYTLVV